MSISLKSGDIYYSLARGREVSDPYKDCYAVLYPELWIDETFLTAYLILGTTLEGGEYPADAPWEITAAYAEKAFYHYHSRVHSWQPRKDATCGEWGVRWGWEYDMSVVFLEDES